VRPDIDQLHILLTRADWLEPISGLLEDTGVRPRLLPGVARLAHRPDEQVALLLQPADLADGALLLQRLEPFDPLQLRVVYAGPLSDWQAAGLPLGLLHAVLGREAELEAAAIALRGIFELHMAGETVLALEGCMDRYSSDLDEILTIGKQLTAEKDHRRLLRLMLTKSMDLTGADAGSIFLVEEAEGGARLRFSITDTRSLIQHRRFEEFTMPLTTSSVAGYVATTGNPLLVEDAYQLDPELEYRFDPSYDRTVGYRTKSMLVVPLVNHLGQILGVIQLINAKGDSRRRAADLRELEDMTQPFTVAHKDLIMAIAGQAAVSIENNRLYHDIERLFEGFVEASVTAIESRDPTTSGHSFRVAELTVALARAADQATEGAYGGLRLGEENLKEIRYASLLHDFGKVGVREEVLTKPKKLLHFRLGELVSRFEWVRQDAQIRSLRCRLDLLARGDKGQEGLEEELSAELARLEEWLRLVVQANEPSVLPAEAPARLEEIHRFRFRDATGVERPLLDAEELKILSIPRGSLTPEEWDDMQGHVVHTWNFLRRIPWTRGLAQVPVIAYAHHEKLDGSGYPRRLGPEQIPAGSRMMTIADIYDALTASDRPYKKAVSHEQALDILSWEANHGKVDRDLLDLFVQRRIHQAIHAAERPSAV
jgi:HD-GYP domain-containing protein (c-di-GMP phosphodiesterase class II)